MKKYSPYIGCSERAPKMCFVMVRNNFISGKIIEYRFPKHGIIGTYVIKCDDGKIRKAETIYKEVEL